MPNPTLYPLTFEPVLKSYLWGGRGLSERLGRQLPEGPVAESWEIAAHRHGSTRVALGPLAGLGLPEVQERLGVELVGERNRAALDQGRFPLLIKLLDAHSWLSVQVHPTDDYALARENDLGKSEMWVVLHADPGAELILGFRRGGVDRADFESAVAAGETDRWLHRAPVHAGDAFYVPAGSVHALGPGILLAEIQQNSDTTYRIHDWGRVDSDGQPRALHVERALEVLDYSVIEPGAVTPRVAKRQGWTVEELARCPYFLTERWTATAEASGVGSCDGETFEIWGAIAGAVDLEPASGETLRLTAVSWALLPAAMGDYRFRAPAGARLLRVTTPPQPGC